MPGFSPELSDVLNRPSIKLVVGGERDVVFPADLVHEPHHPRRVGVGMRPEDCVFGLYLAIGNFITGGHIERGALSFRYGHEN